MRDPIDLLEWIDRRKPKWVRPVIFILLLPLAMLWAFICDDSKED